ncbi:two-component sensor histidine kinase [Phytohabitans rumicis]|uniref:histidine kinase n=2 Tax=Phytohabitans rumicis TaxID=1076125 RepID=A0A6V8LDX4_9ACTN|nr:two-component sensor histidine kinase [Phytohabitans rumicis]
MRRLATAHPTAFRAAGAGLVFLLTILAAATSSSTALTPAVYITGAVVSASFVVVPARHWPTWLILATATVGAIAMKPTGPADSPARPALILAMLVFSVLSEKTAVLAATIAVSGALALAGSVTAALEGRLELANLAALAWVVAAAALGQAIRANRAQRAMLVERARRAEQSREDEARRRVQAERLRIARELHDAVGHQVALINVQAGAMTFLLEKDPAKARESLEHIQNASEAALAELKLTVGLLRQPGEHEPVEPAGRLSRLNELIASFTASGLRVTCDVTGPARPLPDAVDLTAYRLIQESLTNSAKHAAGASASIRLAFRPGTLALTVEDDGAQAPAGEAGTMGHGIIGMRERAAALGGRLSASPRPEGGFRVTAELPTAAGATS